MKKEITETRIAVEDILTTSSLLDTVNIRDLEEVIKKIEKKIEVIQSSILSIKERERNPFLRVGSFLSDMKETCQNTYTSPHR